MRKSELKGLQNKIAQGVGESRAFNTRISDLSGMARWQVRVDKREHGWWTRRDLLAYAFLRGVPYSKVETTTDPENNPRPSPACIVQAIEEFFPMVKKDLEHDVESWYAGTLEGYPEIFAAPAAPEESAKKLIGEELPSESRPSLDKDDASDRGLFGKIGRALRAVVGA